MKSTIKILSLLLSIIAMYFLGLCFAINRLYLYTGITKSINPLIIAISILGLVLLSNFLQESKSNYFTQGFYNGAYLLFALAFMFIFVTVILEIIKFVLNIKIQEIIFAYSIIVITLLLFVYSFINSLVYNEKEVIIKNKKIVKNVKIVHLSDIHLFGINSKNRFENVFKKAMRHNPDYIIITGDLFDKPGKIPLDTLEITNKYKVPVIYVHGNHDLLYGEEKVKDILNNGKVILLDTNSYQNKNISFIGVKYEKKEGFLKKELSKLEISKNNFNILLYHEPKDIPVAKAKGIDLMLSGHTHGGQAFPITLLIRSIYDYYKGVNEYQGMKIIVSQGTSFWGPKIRLGTKNEIIVIKLEQE